jgi:hypothetical protein
MAVSEATGKKTHQKNHYFYVMHAEMVKFLYKLMAVSEATGKKPHQKNHYFYVMQSEMVKFLYNGY